MKEPVYCRSVRRVFSPNAVRAWRAAVLLMAVSLCASDVSAQSAYVSGSLGADVARAGSVDGQTSPGNGEALSFSLRLGGAVTPRFGVELDFTRPSEIETNETPDVRILAETYGSIAAGSLSGAVPGTANLVMPVRPIVNWDVHTIQRVTTITAAAWVRQEVSPRLSLVYLGGVAFAKVDQTMKVSFDYLPIYTAIFPPTYDTKTVDYDQGPMAGLEARINLTDHAQLVPGVRLLSVADAWIVRPAVGLGWRF